MSHPVTRGILEWLKLLAAEANDETYEFHDYAATDLRDTLGKYGDAIFDLALKGLEDAVCPTCSGSGKETYQDYSYNLTKTNTVVCNLCQGSGKALSADDRRLEINHITNQLYAAEHALQRAREKLGRLSRRPS